MSKVEMSDSELRQLRTSVYGECSDKNWEEVRNNWRKPEALRWLKEKAAKPLKFS